MSSNFTLVASTVASGLHDAPRVVKQLIEYFGTQAKICSQSKNRECMLYLCLVELAFIRSFATGGIALWRFLRRYRSNYSPTMYSTTSGIGINEEGA